MTPITKHPINDVTQHKERGLTNAARTKMIMTTRMYGSRE